MDKTSKNEPESKNSYENLVKKTNYLRPYVQPTDPSMYSPVYPSDPHPKIREIADVMIELYKLFIEMRYINAADVSFPPHTSKPISLAKAALFGLSKDVVDLMQMLPYYHHECYPNWNYGSDGGEFLEGGEFCEDLCYEDADWFLHIVDPLYYTGLIYNEDVHAQGWDGYEDYDKECEEENDDSSEEYDDDRRLYMRDYHFALNNLGNHGTVFLLDTKTCLISATDQESGNLHDYEEDCATYFRSVINKFRTLEDMPGGLYKDRYKYAEKHEDEEMSYDYLSLKRVYLEAGWSKNFNIEKFDALMKERDEGKKQLRLEKPIRDLDKQIQKMLSRRAHQIEYEKLTAELATLPSDADTELKGKLEGKRELEEMAIRKFTKHFDMWTTEHKKTLKERTQWLQQLENGEYKASWITPDNIEQEKQNARREIAYNEEYLARPEHQNIAAFEVSELSRCRSMAEREKKDRSEPSNVDWDIEKKVAPFRELDEWKEAMLAKDDRIALWKQKNGVV